MGENLFLKHKIFLLSIFLIGNTIIVFPRGSGSYLAFLAVAVATIPAVFITLILFKVEKELIKTPFVLSLILALFGVLVFIICTRDYIDFVDVMRLPKTPKFLLTTLFVIVSVILGVSKRKTLYIFGLYSFFATAIIFVFVFILSIPKLDFNFLLLDNFDLKLFLNQTLTFFIHSFGQLVIMSFFLARNREEPNKKVYIFGILFGVVFMLIYILNIMLVLGGKVAQISVYPYSTLTSLVSFGDDFSRLDGFTYFVYFFSSILKNAVCINVILSFFNKKRTTALILAVVLILLCNFVWLQDLLHTDLANLIILIFELTFPFVLLASIKFLRK